MKVFGPYKGSKQNGGRPIYVFKRLVAGVWKTTSSNKARVEYEKATGKTLPKTTDVDHKDNGGRAGRDGKKNLQTMSHSRNVAKENKRRAVKKTTAKRVTKKKP